MRGILSF